MLKTRPRIRWFAVVGLTIGAACAGGCTRTPYVIGAVCPTGDGGSPIDAACPGGGDAPTDGAAGNATFAADLDRSGATALGPLELPGGAPLFTLRGQRAAATAWTGDEGVTLGPGGAVPELALPAPFTDDTRAVGLPASARSYVAETAALGAVGADDFVLEVVLRAGVGATIAEKATPAGAGWSLLTDPAGLALVVGDADPAHVIEAAAPLVADAWSHCLAWVSRGAGMRVDCNGRAGTLLPVLAVGSLDVPTPLSLGGGTAAARVAHLALTRVPAGGLGDPSKWLDIGRRRFAALTGAAPKVAKGSALPRPGLRDSSAYVDLQDAPGAPRRLFLVGPDWPRVACRADSAGVRDCGFLSEPQRMRRVPADARMWTASEIAASAPGGPLATEGPPLIGLVPSTAFAPHTLTMMAADTPARQVFSFFVRAGTSTRVGARVGALGTAIYSLADGRVLTTLPNVRATLEDWGGGLWRCTYAYTGVAGAVAHVVQLVDDANASSFAGDGAMPAVQVAGLQVDLGLVLAGSLQAVDMQPADHLTFEGADGNLPSGRGAVIDVRVLLPPGPRLTDQAIFNLNRGTAFDDQVQLFVRGDLGVAEFWGISTGKTYWTFDNPSTVIDGKRHVMRASWGLTSAHITVDGVTQEQTVLLPDPPPFTLDRVDIGFSEKSGGPLEGLVAGLSIGAP
jgi:hypothetical protein